MDAKKMVQVIVVVYNSRKDIKKRSNAKYCLYVILKKTLSLPSVPEGRIYQAFGNKNRSNESNATISRGVPLAKFLVAPARLASKS